MPRKSKPSISWREKAVALVGALTLAYTAWGFGGVIAWSLHIMLAGGLLTFTLALVPLRGIRDPGSEIRDKKATTSRILEAKSRPSEALRARDGPPPAPSKRSVDPPKLLERRTGRISSLLRTPAFYFALAFLLYLAVAALNPAWRIVSDERGWWLESMEPPLADWLPTSVASDYEPMNAWRIFNMHLAALSLALGLSIGLTRRGSVQFVLWAFFLSGAAMAVVALIQHYTGEERRVVWSLRSQNRYPWGSFFYRNQGAAYLNLVMVAGALVFFYHGVKCRLQARSGGPHFLAACLLALVAYSVAMALSRGGILFGGAFLAAFLLLLLVFFLQGFFHQRTFLLSLIPLVLLGGAGYYSMRYVDLDVIEERFSNFEEELEKADRNTRGLLTRQTWKMAQDQPWLGWGAGSFRYAFPMYQREYNQLAYIRKDRRQGWVGPMFFRYAHNDLVQFVAEYGYLGASLLLGFLFSLLGRALFCAGEHWLVALALLAGVLCAFGHAFFDFIFSSPAYWVAFVGLIALTSRLLVLEFKRAAT